MPIHPDPSKNQAVLRGPFSFFDASLIVEFLEPPAALQATCLIRTTFKGPHALITAANAKTHPVVPPLHLHFDQIETFQILQGRFGVTLGWDLDQHILTPEDDPFDVQPWAPHCPWPIAGNEDTIVLMWAHPKGVDDALDLMFFEQIFKTLDESWRQGKPVDTMQMMVSMHATASTGVMLPTWKFLGPLRWWVPWLAQAGMAGLAGLLGYRAVNPKFLKD